MLNLGYKTLEAKDMTRSLKALATLGEDPGLVHSAHIEASQPRETPINEIQYRF